MSVQFARSDVVRAESDLADLGKRIATETRKEADLRGKLASATASMNNKLTASAAMSKAREVESITRDLARVQQARADLEKRAASKRADLHRHLDRLSREEATEQRKRDDDEKRRRREQESYDRRLKDGLSEMRTAFQPLGGYAISSPLGATAILAPLGTSPIPFAEPEHDFFISHASEDKEDFVRALAEALRERGAAVWYDEFALKWGDSLRRSIDKGLASSRFGVVVFSEYFFKKEWTQRELDGLNEMEIGGRSRILPIWHKVSKDEVRRFSPVMADRLAMNTATKSVGELADELMRLLEPPAS